MILEVAILEVKKGLENRFVEDFKKASEFISSIDGYLNHKLKRCLEQKNSDYLLLFNELYNGITHEYMKE